MLISDVYHNYQFLKVILINVTFNTIGSCIFFKNTLMYQRYSACKLHE